MGNMIVYIQVGRNKCRSKKEIVMEILPVWMNLIRRQDKPGSLL